MKRFMTWLGVVSLVAGNLFTANAQSFTIKPGKWSAPSTWSGGIVPDHTAGSITIYHAVRVPPDTSLIVDEITLFDTLKVEHGSSVTLNNGPGSVPDLQISTGFLNVYGKIICKDGATFSGTSAMNTFFR